MGNKCRRRKNSNALAKDIGRQSRGGLELAIGREGDPVGLEIVGDGLAATGGALVPGGAPELGRLRCSGRIVFSSTQAWLSWVWVIFDANRCAPRRLVLPTKPGSSVLANGGTRIIISPLIISNTHGSRLALEKLANDKFAP